MKNHPKTKDNTLGVWAYLAIEKHFKKTIKYEKDVLKDQNPENLHQMRVGMRRLRSAATGFAPALALPKPAQEKQIGKIARILGELRDLDVLLEALTVQYASNLPKKERKILDGGLAILTKQRKTAFKKIKKTLKHDRYLTFKDSVNQWLKSPSYQPLAVMNIDDVLPDLLSPEVNRFFLQPGWMVGCQAQKALSLELDRPFVEQELTERGTNLHNLRKQAKRVRYQMSLFTQFYSPDYQTYLADMKTIQDVLGCIQDTEVLAAVLADVLQEKINRVLPTLAQQLADTRYELWQQWAPLHDRYINPQTRQTFRTVLLHPSSATPTVEQRTDRDRNDMVEESVPVSVSDHGRSDNGRSDNERSALQNPTDSHEENHSSERPSETE